MPGNLIIVLIFLTFVVNCSNLNNQNDQVQLICGETKDKSFAWLHIENVEGVDAILVKDGSVKTASKTQKSCIAITEADRDHQLFVRDSSTKKFTLSL